ncbi:MAG: heat-inducible transcriptional repressor HrcA [candidate division Zixibacteria bacterium]|nr:heat-inducible transcriptional repressor HrcA [candidate division Zixibacteria bacterium]
MAFDKLTDREKQILYNLINYYIESADPVGSRVIANKFKMGISSATIRNTLADLEDLELVVQPHTSAGRIPTDLGYRVYIDYLLKPEELNQAEKDVIKQTILRDGRGLNEVLGQTCKVLGDITNQLGVTIAPRFDKGILKRIELIPLTSERIMVVVVVESGLARSIIIEIEASIKEIELKDFEELLNERLSGLTLGTIKESITERLADVAGHGRLIKLVIDTKDRIWTEESSDDIHYAGMDKLLEQPEFSNLERVSELVKVLGNGKVLSDFLRSSKYEGLVITIGKENKFHEIMQCSLVTASYKVGNITGAIGIVGPTRMPYKKLTSIVEYTAKTITEVIAGIDYKED